MRHKGLTGYRVSWVEVDTFGDKIRGPRSAGVAEGETDDGEASLFDSTTKSRHKSKSSKGRWGRSVDEGL